MSKTSVFEECPVYESEHFLLRNMRMEDAHGLFQCYSNPEAAKYFNGDCCLTAPEKSSLHPLKTTPATQAAWLQGNKNPWDNGLKPPR